MAGQGALLGFNDANLTIDENRTLYVGGVEATDTPVVKIAKQMQPLIAKANVLNPVSAAPYSAAPAWVASTAYVNGQMVRGIGAGNTDNVYVCVQGGTSAAATGPTGIDSAGIVDNTVRWIYVGKGNAATNIPLYSSVTPASASDVMDGYTAVVASATLTTLGLTRQFNNLLTDNIARYTGGPIVDEGGRVAIRGPNTGSLASPSYLTSSQRWMAHIKTDCRKWIAIQPITHAQNPCHIEINGRPLTEGNYCAAAVVATGCLLIDLSKFGPGVKDLRFYDVNLMREVYFRVFVAADENVWTPTPTSSIKMCFEGDSITQFGGIGPRIWGYAIEQLICKQLGIERWYNNAVGGTGAISNNGGAATTYLERLPDIVSENPDILLIGGFHNDNQSSQQQQIDAFLTYFQAIRNALPNCTVFVVGTQMLANESIVAGTNSHFDLENNVRTAFNLWNDGNSAFIPTITRSYKFPGSTADGWFYLAGGASPFNDSHPVPRYYPAYAGLVVESIREFFNSKLL